jgi:glycosyltransferase involved in cell wall biosynthesis
MIVNKQSPSKIKVLQLITGLGMGGAEKVVLDLSTYISIDKFDTYVLGISNNDELLDEFVNNNIKTTLLRQSNSIINIFNIIQKINIFIKKNKINIIHAHMVHPVIIASILKILNPSLKIVYTSHSLNIGSKMREILVWILKPFRNIDIVFSKDILKFFYKNNYKIIPNGVKVDKYSLNIKKNNKFTFIAIGRLVTVKNHKKLIEIASELKNKYDFQILIVGHGELKESLSNLITKYKLENYIHLLGLRKDIPKLLNQSHCLLMPSLWEGLPITILEAGASSLPVISTPVGSIPSLLNNGNSYMVDIDNFKDTMEYILNNYNNALLKANNLYQLINNSYSIANIVKKHENIYRELIK